MGNDLLNGQEGEDSLFGFDGDDTLFGFIGNDSLFGEAGNDVMLGEDGADFLGGLDGNDFMVGGRGADTLWGDAGDDIFVFALADLQNGVSDEINSFGEVVGNFDRIRFEGILPGNVAITQVGSDALINITGVPGGGIAAIRVTNFAAPAMSDQFIFV
jgi:Ca2+-binding RTX toxin-like protein